MQACHDGSMGHKAEQPIVITDRLSSRTGQLAHQESAYLIAQKLRIHLQPSHGQHQTTACRAIDIEAYC